MSTEDDPPEPDPIHIPTAVVLAAGRGTRMHSDRPKVLHPLCGRAMAAHVLHALAESEVLRVVVVVPPGESGDAIRAELRDDAPQAMELAFAVQPSPLGTADAVLRARPYVRSNQTLVVNGDLALLSPSQLTPLLRARACNAAVIAAVVDNPARMGRIIRSPDDRLHEIVEWRDATNEQRAIHEVNVGIYRFDSEFLWNTLGSLCEGSSGMKERYVTDVITIAAARGSALAVGAALPEGRLNVENLLDAADAETAIRRRINRRLLADGVQITDPAATWIDARAQIESRVVIEPGSHIRGRSSVGAGTRIGPAAILEDASVGVGCTLESCTIKNSSLANHVEVGPYSTIRPGCDLADHVHIGTHAELKNVRLGPGVQVGHFSYLGDAKLGAGVNVGAGAITCNFDGERKHQTTIGDHAFIGSDTMLVAPITIGARARTGAGSVVTKDVPADANVVGAPARVTPAGRTTRRQRQAPLEASS